MPACVGRPRGPMYIADDGAILQMPYHAARSTTKYYTRGRLIASQLAVFETAYILESGIYRLSVALAALRLLCVLCHYRPGLSRSGCVRGSV